MPFKSNADRRRHIPKQRHRVTNLAEYDAGLRARGSLTVLMWTARARQRISRRLDVPIGLTRRGAAVERLREARRA